MGSLLGCVLLMNNTVKLVSELAVWVSKDVAISEFILPLIYNILLTILPQLMNMAIIYNI